MNINEDVRQESHQKYMNYVGYAYCVDKKLQHNGAIHLVLVMNIYINAEVDSVKNSKEAMLKILNRKSNL